MSAGAVRRRPHRHRAVSSPLPGMRTFITSLFFFMQESRPQESDSSSFTWCERPARESMNGHVLECCGTAQTDVIEELRVPARTKVNALVRAFCALLLSVILAVRYGCRAGADCSWL